MTEIVALGATTAVGLTAATAAAAIRAGIGRIQLYPHMVDRHGEPMSVAPHPRLDPNDASSIRLEHLLASSLDQVLAYLEPLVSAGSRIPLVLGLPAARPGMTEADIQRGLLDPLARPRQGRSLSLHLWATVEGRGCAGLEALRQGFDLIRRRELRLCVVATADTLVARSTLQWLDDDARLLGKRNPWGMVPGEAGVAVLLVDPSHGRGLPGDDRGSLEACASAREPAPRGSGEVCVGLGLTAALEGALGSCSSGEKVTDLYCDMDGDRYHADEFGFTCARLSPRFVDITSFVSPVEAIGVVGGATGLFGVVLAVRASARRHARGPLAMVFSSSDSRERAAALLRFHSTRSQG